MFTNSNTAGEWVAQHRWGNEAKNFTCPRCGHHDRPGSSSELHYRCRACHTISSPLTGSVLGKAKLDPADVIWLAWQLASNPGGLSAVTASRETGMSRQSAQRALTLIRHALAESEEARALSGVVEADETFLGGKASGGDKRGRSPVKKCVLVLSEERGSGACIVRYVPNAQAKNLIPIINNKVEEGSTIHTDGHASYVRLSKRGYKHEVSVVRGAEAEAHVLLPGVHQVAKNLKSQIYGTHKRTPKDELLQDYLGAFQWRYNRRHLDPIQAFLEIMDVVLRKGAENA